jgi:hypothetical protein
VDTKCDGKINEVEKVAGSCGLFSEVN